MAIRDTIAGDLRTAINQGDYAPGATLPSEPHLARQYDVSPSTARMALTMLAGEGLVIADHGRGWRVRQYDRLNWDLAKTPHSDTEHEQAAWAAGIIKQGRTPHEHVEVALVPAPPHVAERLHLPHADTIVTRRYLRYVDHTPWQLATSYYPRDIAEGTPIMEPSEDVSPGGSPHKAEHTQVRHHDEIKIRMASHDESTHLHLPTCTPVAEHIRTGYNEADRPIHVAITIAPGDRHVLIFDPAAE